MAAILSTLRILIGQRMAEMARLGIRMALDDRDASRHRSL
jgi:hypothetical protein